MTSKTPSSLGQQFFGDISSDKIPADGNTNDFCLQTGEEFSTQFLRDRVAQRRAVDPNQVRQTGFNKQNNQMGYEDLASVRGIRRNSSECEDLDFGRRAGYTAELENVAYPDNVSRCNTGVLIVGKSADQMNSDSVSSFPTTPQSYVLESPRSYPYGTGVSESSLPGRVKFLCSFGGRILPRPNDGKLRYIGGETRIMSIRINITWKELVKKTSAICNQPHVIKYQLPGEDLDALISVSSDEDLHHMIEEYQELERNGGSQRLWIFLIPSGEPESPKSFEARTPQQNDDDYHYVSAVNGMLDLSPQKSSNGQSLPSLTNQFGTASEFGQTFHAGSPKSTTVLDRNDCGPTSSNPFFNPLQVQGNLVNQSPPVSPVTLNCRDNSNNSNVQFYVDQQCPDGNANFSPFAIEKNPFNITYHLNAPANCNNIPHGLPPLMNFHRHHQTDQTNKPPALHFHNRSPSEDFLSNQLHAQISMNPERAFKERAWSDSQLQEHDEVSGRCFEDVSPLSLWNNGGEKSPSFALANASQESSMPLQHKTGDKNQVDKNENLCSCKTPDNIDLNPEAFKCMDQSVTCSDEERKQYKGNVEAASIDNATAYNNLASLNSLTSIHGPVLDTPKSGATVHNNPVNLLKEISVDVGGVRSQGQQSDNDLCSLFDKSENVVKGQQCAMSKKKSFEQVSPKGQHSSSLGSDTQETPVRGLNSGTSGASSRVISLHNLESMNYPEHNSKKDSSRGNSYERPKIGYSFCVQSQPSKDTHDNEVFESVVIVEDVTGNTPPDVSCSSVVIPRVEEGSINEFPSHGDTLDERLIGVSVDLKGNSDIGESISDASMAEMEAGIYGLQIIRNADIEEVQELGSGTFGTVYYGKWRGTDVAIKRIKKSCFSGKPSEQERLTKDFWREAQILSTLHHPNVVAFYGVVPDGSGGTMATVTEYMVNGSLRHALRKKERGLDRRRKVMLALDAAFGMEYLHLKDIVHFDLKCDNLLVNLRDPQRPICKVGDFGLSRIKHNTFVSGGVRGTLPWMAPELLDGSKNRVSEKVDVYSFGITMWEILTGEEPYANMHCGAIIGGIASNKLRPCIPENCDPEWRKLMEECWSFDPKARPSFTEITNRLRVMVAALQPKRRNLPIT